MRRPGLILVICLLGAAGPAMAAPLWKCVDSAGVSQYVQKKIAGRCSAVQPAPPPPSRPYVPQALPADVPVPRAALPPLPLMEAPGTPPRALPPLPGEALPAPSPTTPPPKN